jgi:hypothetical protein
LSNVCGMTIEVGAYNAIISIPSKLLTNILEKIVI